MIAIKKDNGISNIQLCDGRENFFVNRGYTILDNDDINRILNIINNDISLPTDVKFSKMPPLDEIIEYCCDLIGIEKSSLYGDSRLREIVCVRYLIMYICRWFNYGSLKRIGKIFGKDHATCIYGCKTIENLLDTKDTYFYQYIVEAMRHFNMYKKNI